jgi:hypothetical protein
MAIQPGVGFSFTQSSHGTTLDINAGYTDPAPTVPLEQFKVVMDGNKVYVAKGRVINRKADSATTYLQSDLVGGCLREFNLVNMAVYPTGSKTAATVPNTSFLDDGASFELTPEELTPPKKYALCIILNQYRVHSGTLLAGTPYAALMEVDEDAFTKTRPWGGEDYCDQQWFAQISRLGLVEVPINADPTDPTLNIKFWYTHSDTYNTESFTPMPFYLKNYNCQRLRIATITYNNDNNVWDIEQHLLGPITIPYNIALSGIYEITDGSGDPSWLTTPLNDTEQTAWEGAYTDSDKWDGTGDAPTLTVDL